MAFTILKTVGGMLLLIAVGVVCGRLGLIDGAAEKKLSGLLVNVIQPAFLFMAFQQPFDGAMFASFWVCMGLAALAFLVLVLAPRLLLPKAMADREVSLLLLTFPNVGFFGAPIVLSMYGEQGVFYLSTVIMVFNLLLWTYGVVVASGEKLEGKTALKKLMSPVLAGVLLGLGCFCLGFTVPEAVASPLSMLGNMVTPLSMLLIGSIVSRADIGEGIKNKQVYGICLGRTVILPLLVALLLFWLPVNRMLVIIVTLCAGFPCASMALVLSVQYNKNSVLAGECAALTALLCVGTTPLLYGFLSLLTGP